MVLKVTAQPKWDLIRLAYVQSIKTMAQIALEFDVSHAAVMKRAANGKWVEARQVASDAVITAASQRIEVVRTDELSKWNATDLRLANALRSQVAASINAAVLAAAPLQPSAIRGLASALEAIQRVGRLALGASTDNVGHAGQDGNGPIAVATVTLEEYEAALVKILALT